MDSRLVVTFVMLFFLLSSSVSAVSIGVSPGRVHYRNLLQEGYAERTVSVSTNSDVPVTANIDVRGEIQDWLRFEPNGTTIVLQRTQPYRLTIIAEPPADVRNGTYTGSIQVVTDHLGDVQSRAGGLVKAAVTLIVNLEVINEEITQCRAGGFDFKDVEIDFPFDISLTVINDGNVRVRPSIAVDVWDQLQEELLVSRELLGDEVLPTVERRMERQFTDDLAVGQYWATISVDECQASDLVTFSVVEKGGIADKGVLKDITNKVWVETGEPVEITATFQNLGTRTVFSKFKGSIKLDNEIVKVIDTEELEVPAGEITTFADFFTPERAGRYVISGRVIYNKKLTFEKGSVLNVNPGVGGDEEKSISVGLLLLIYLAIIVTIVFMVRKIVKEKKRPKRKIF